jgi:hypothetical protein
MFCCWQTTASLVNVQKEDGPEGNDLLRIFIHFHAEEWMDKRGMKPLVVWSEYSSCLVNKPAA